MRSVRTRRSHSALMAPCSTKYLICAVLPPETLLMMHQAASFWMAGPSMASSRVTWPKTSALTISCSCSSVPAMTLDSAQQHSLRMALSGCLRSSRITGRAPASTTAWAWASSPVTMLAQTRSAALGSSTPGLAMRLTTLGRQLLSMRLCMWSQLTLEDGPRASPSAARARQPWVSSSSSSEPRRCGRIVRAAGAIIAQLRPGPPPPAPQMEERHHVAMRSTGSLVLGLSCSRTTWSAPWTMSTSRSSLSVAMLPIACSAWMATLSCRLRASWTMMGSAPCLTTAWTHCASVQMLVRAQLASYCSVGVSASCRKKTKRPTHSLASTPLKTCMCLVRPVLESSLRMSTRPVSCLSASSDCRSARMRTHASMRCDDMMGGAAWYMMGTSACRLPPCCCCPCRCWGEPMPPPPPPPPRLTPRRTAPTSKSGAA
mmetsp:Transcript_67629/g.163492  ORF Transcript_67629/g.163492 Transcript_67629/m.163492 type:complete len:430 (-) Transcript_67629:2295-3584(-)